MKKIFASTGLAATLLLASIAGTTAASAAEPAVTSITNQSQFTTFASLDGKEGHFQTIPLNEDDVEIAPPNYADEDDYTDKDEAESLWVREAPNFKDISGHYAERQIIALYQMGIVNGTNETTYGPNKQLTRAQFASMLMNTIVEVESEVKDAPGFKDINNHWAKEDIVQLYKLGVINGSSPTTFEPDKPITRQQAAAMMERYLIVVGVDMDEFSNTLPFNDSNKISEYARSGVSVLANMGVVSGDPNGYFNPSDTLTRGQMAKILYGVIEYMIVEEATAQ
ncbi:S-layer homology domain-containing protein [Lysinibacillus sp. UGB7]|uniref:S-layer homology domain-containing protein n=1 Tax=Lysinibacillus sp. UGB7 TaxID=3411039 RepID=UPI003B7A3CD6